MEMFNLANSTSQIVAAYVSNHNVPVEELPQLIRQVSAILGSLDSKAQPMAALPPRPAPAVPLEQSVGDDYIICLEDGKKLKMLKRHLQSAYGMTLEQYKARWDLPDDYPTVAPAYSKKRSKLARTIGLGRKAKA